MSGLLHASVSHGPRNIILVKFWRALRLPARMPGFSGDGQYSSYRFPYLSRGCFIHSSPRKTKVDNVLIVAMLIFFTKKQR